MLNDLAYIERDNKPAPQVFLVKKRRSDLNLPGGDKLFHHADEPCQQVFFVPFPTRLHLIEDAAGGLEGDLLPAKFLAQFFKIDF